MTPLSIKFQFSWILTRYLNTSSPIPWCLFDSPMVCYQFNSLLEVIIFFLWLALNHKYLSLDRLHFRHVCLPSYSWKIIDCKLPFSAFFLGNPLEIDGVGVQSPSPHSVMAHSFGLYGIVLFPSSSALHWCITSTLTQLSFDWQRTFSFKEFCLLCFIQFCPCDSVSFIKDLAFGSLSFSLGMIHFSYYFLLSSMLSRYSSSLHDCWAGSWEKTFWWFQHQITLACPAGNLISSDTWWRSPFAPLEPGDLAGLRQT